MKTQIKKGVGFGLTSGIITTLGLMVGLTYGTHSKLAVIGGILTIAIADAFSDALGIHISEESENSHSAKQIWAATIATFISKVVFASLFILPVLFFTLESAVKISIIWSLGVLGALSYKLAKAEKEKPWKAIAEHLTIATVVIIVTHYVGIWVAKTFV